MRRVECHEKNSKLGQSQKKRERERDKGGGRKG